MSKFDLSTDIVCISVIDGTKVDGVYHVKGAGDLAMTSDKSGYGFCVSDIWGKYYYFTESEMNTHFITNEESYKSYRRDELINQILEK
jgi:YHS domain-containing protein